MLPDLRFCRETVSLLDVTWPRSNRWERALLGKISKYIAITIIQWYKPWLKPGSSIKLKCSYLVCSICGAEITSFVLPLFMSRLRWRSPTFFRFLKANANVSTFRGKIYLRNKNNPVQIRRIANDDFIAVVVLQSALLGNFLHHVIRPCAEHLMFSGGKKGFLKSIYL